MAELISDRGVRATVPGHLTEVLIRSGWTDPAAPVSKPRKTAKKAPATKPVKEG